MTDTKMLLNIHVSYPRKQSDQGIHCLLFHLFLLELSPWLNLILIQGESLGMFKAKLP